MHYFTFIITFGLLLTIIIWANIKHGMLKDVGFDKKRPYSYSRVQMAWWCTIVLSSYITIYVCEGMLPDLWPSTLYLLGISTATTATGTLIDLSNSEKLSPANPTLPQNQKGENLLFDILSDKNDISLHRLQGLVINLTMGIWFIQNVLNNIGLTADCAPCKSGQLTGNIKLMQDCLTCHQNFINHIMPDISPNNLILLGLSAGVYAGMKSTESKQPLLPAKNETSGKPDPVKLTEKIG